ncbi:MAG: DUF2341 domain-containing protein [Candidatus Heimdallarchaeaceae archaeon]
MAWLTGYTTRIKLTTDNTKVDSTLTDFPVLVKLTSSELNFSHANSDGFDIRFTSSDGTTLLKYERARYDNANSEAEFWVKVPSVSSSAGTDFYIYYRTTDTADGSDKTNTWNSDYVGVYHLEEGNADAIDTTGTNTLTKSGTITQSTGQVGKGVSGFCEANGIKKTSGATVYTTGNADRANFFSIYLNALPPSDWAEFFAVCTGTTSTNNWFTSIIGRYPTAVHQLNSALHSNDAKLTYSCATGVWLRMAWVYTASNKTTTFYINGVSQGGVAHSSNSNFSNTGLAIGNSYSSQIDGYAVDGIMDEVFLYNAAPNAAWVKADYNSINDSLLTYGSEETASAFIPTIMNII